MHTTTDLRDTMQDGTRARVITYQSPRGDLIDMTPAEVAAWEAAGLWPTDAIGQSYSSVSHGLHDAVLGSAATPMRRRVGMPNVA